MDIPQIKARHRAWVRRHPVISAVAWFVVICVARIGDLGGLIGFFSDQVPFTVLSESIRSIGWSWLPGLGIISWGLTLIGVVGVGYTIYLVTTDPRTPPSSADMAAVEGLERLREVYRQHGASAANSIVVLLSKVKDALSSENTFANLLHFPIDRVRQGRAEIHESLGSDSLSEARRSLYHFLQAYYLGIRWLHNAEDEGFELTEKPYAVRYRTWEESHEALESGLLALAKRNAFAGLEVQIMDLATLEEYKRTKVQRNVVRRRLRELTEPEMEFLRIFADPSEDPLARYRIAEKRENLFPARTFDAGRRLARDGVLTKKGVGDKMKYGWSACLFSLRHATEEEIRDTGLIDMVRRSIRIPLDIVQGSLGGGSGATGAGWG